jgi:hypothetical protein
MVSDQLRPDPHTPDSADTGTDKPSVTDDSGPIDVHELLESTRKLFDADDIAQALQQAGFTDPAPTESDQLSADDDAPADQPEQLSAESAVEAGRSDTEPDAEGEELDEDGATRRGVNILAIISLVLALTLSPLAVIFGYIALGQTRRAHQRGEAIALWGIGLGWVVFAAWAIGVGALWWIAAEQGITFDALGELIDFLRIP